MLLRLSDNPVPVSLDLLRKLDAEAPGRWLAQPKLDGWRRFAYKFDGKWTWKGKPQGSGWLQAIPPDLRREFEALPWPDGIGLDIEWLGFRMVENKMPHSLHVFDLLYLDGKWTGDWTPFSRGQYLSMLFPPERTRVHLVRNDSNPGLVDRFMEQLQNPLSEGLVVRRADSTIIGDSTKCKDNPLWFKVKYRDVRKRKVL